jgi:hypothetical protein
MNAQDNKIINGNCWVAYFDILGFSKIVEIFPVCFVLEEYKKALEESKRSNIKCKFKFFSDCFIFYTEDDSMDSFSCIEGTSALFFRAMFLKKELPHFPMRGCLNWGQFYADEENGVFFGPAQIEAYKLAEGQNWIGFVLSEKTREKLISFESVGIKSGYKKRYMEYKVPYNEKPKLRNLLAYNLNLLTTIGNTGQARNEQYQLWKALDYMKYLALQMLLKNKTDKSVDIEKCSEYKEIITKYDNTEKFMFWLYPALKEMIKKQSPSENMKTI